MEQPDILVSEIRTGLRTLRSRYQHSSSGAHAYHSGFTESTKGGKPAPQREQERQVDRLRAQADHAGCRALVGWS
ncbi:hypothetical protein CF165_26855 [Amycolatopsis vastitatis]|uniref:Uncharacterized protein n=1 Tax=Amycolatopsis vastitatis TaxID=1905142 RepID=A0A229T052_9PSEU|nr:hypothetical protein CF165_26855 [Amycolatopsis vastitatis]